MIRRTAILQFFLVLCTASLGAQVKYHFKLPRELREASGLVILNDGSFVWHNDSNNEPALYITDGKGNLLNTILYPLPNTDWEDITKSPSDDLFIGNFGNNCHCRQDLAIYLLSDPMTNSIDSINFQLPDQQAFPPSEKWRNFDMEAMFWFQDSLHLFSKNNAKKGNSYAKHYVLPAQPGQYAAELRDSVFLKKRFVSGAAISPGEDKVALLSLRFQRILGFIPFSRVTIFVFSDFHGSDFLHGDMKRRGIRPYLYALQYEAIDFVDEETLVVGSEKTSIIPAKAKRLKLGKRFFK
ncbi:MAG: hypothetical protein IPL49_02345 [Saprospirales bacterium]|nr:hypothetical protein [Saprospirales bacterium]